MATLHQLLSGFQTQVIDVTSGLTMFDFPLLVDVGLDWPPMTTIQSITKMSPPKVLVSIFDRKHAKDSTRWAEGVVAQTIVPATLTSSPTYQLVAADGLAQITIGGSVTPGDAVSLVATTRKFMATYPGDESQLNVGVLSNEGAVVYVTNPTDRLIDVAANLAALVNATPSLGFTATSIGPLVNMTSKSSDNLGLFSYTGNGGTNIVEIGRKKREVQITCWAATPENRDTVGDPIEALIGQIEYFRGDQGQFQQGLPLGDGTTARVEAVNDFYLDDAVLTDIYRRDFIVSADYSITVQDKLYSVLAPILAYNLDY